MRTATERSRLIIPRDVSELHTLELGLELIVRHPEHLHACDRPETQRVAEEILCRLKDGE